MSKASKIRKSLKLDGDEKLAIRVQRHCAKRKLMEVNNNDKPAKIDTPEYTTVAKLPKGYKSEFVRPDRYIRNISYYLDAQQGETYDADSEDEEFVNLSKISMTDFESAMAVFQAEKPRTFHQAAKSCLNFNRLILGEIFDFWQRKQSLSNFVISTDKKWSPMYKNLRIFRQRDPKTPLKGTRGEKQKETKALHELWKKATKTKKALLELRELCQNQIESRYNDFYNASQSSVLFEYKHQGTIRKLFIFNSYLILFFQ